MNTRSGTKVIFTLGYLHVVFFQALIHFLAIDHMHMTSQKGAPACWGSNEALPRAPSPSMQPDGQPLHAIPPGWLGPAHWLRGWAQMRSASTTRACSATSLDPQHGVVVMEMWHQCIRSILTAGWKLFLSFFCSRWSSGLLNCIPFFFFKWSDT